MRRRAAYVIAAASLLMGTAATRAEFTMKDITDKKNEKDAPFYISGLYTGMLWYNGLLRQNNVSPLFCAPQDRTVTNDEVTAILLRFAGTLEATEEKSKIMSYPAGLILLHALQHEFPCVPQNHTQISPICSMTETQANSSPNCLRYYFLCGKTAEMRRQNSSSASSPAYHDLVKITAAFALSQSQRNCDSFDYTQAYSAYHLWADGP